MADDGVYDHVEDRGGQGSPCMDPRYSLKGRPEYLLVLSTMASRYQYILRIRTVLGPIPYDERRSWAISRYKVSKGLPYIQEDLKEDRIPHGCKMLEELSLKGSGLLPQSRPKPVESVIEGDRFCESVVDKARDLLPDYF